MSNNTQPGAKQPRQVYFYATCVIDLMAPQAGVDAIELIRAAGIEVEFPQAQSCCGQPAWTSGYTEEARREARNEAKVEPRQEVKAEAQREGKPEVREPRGRQREPMRGREQ